MEREEREYIPAPVYGGPPMPAPQRVWRRWMTWAIGIVVVVAAWLIYKHGIRPPNPLPVYGGPPVPTPHPPGFLMALRDVARRLG